MSWENKKRRIRGNRAETCPPCPRLGINIVSLSRNSGETMTWAAISRSANVLHHNFLSRLLLHSNKLYSACGGSHLLSRQSQIAANWTGSKLDRWWPFSCYCVSATIYRTIVSKLEVWYHWNLKSKKISRVELWKICTWLVLQVVPSKLTPGGKCSHLHRVVRGHRRSSWQGWHKRSHNSHPLLATRAQEICSHSRFFLQGICELQMQNAD